MAGVVEKEARETAANDANATVVGGLRGVVACDILRWGKSTGLCDDDSRLHLPRSREEQGDLNKKEDRNVLNLAEGQLQEIERAYEAYDCDVWHLAAPPDVSSKGTLADAVPSSGPVRGVPPRQE